MTFINDDGEVLDFDGDFAISKRAVSFFNSKILGDVSINFAVDNNSVNRKVLGYDGPQMLNQVAFTRQPFTLMRNGNPFARGFIVIQTDKGATLSCYFISGNSNWINLLNGLITELDYTGVTNGVNYEFQLSSTSYWNATSGVVEPLIDWAYGFNKGSIDNDWSAGQNLVDVKGDTLQSIVDFYPAFYLYTLVDEIAKQNNLKITGNIISDPIYKKLILPTFIGQIKRPDVKVTSAYGTTQSTASATPVQYTNFTDGSDPDGLFANDVYTAVRNSRLQITLTIVTSTVPAGTQLSVVILFNGSPTSGYQTLVAVNDLSITFDFPSVNGSVWGAAFYNSGAAGTVSCTLNIKFNIPTQITAGDYLTPDLFLPPISCFDIIKFLVNYFGCTCSYNEYSKTITMSPIESLKLEDAEDWSEYYQSHDSNYTIQSAQNNYQRVEDPDDSRLKAYNKARTVKYGEGNIETENTLRDVNELLKIPFAPSDFDLAKNGVWITSVPIIKLKDAGEAILYQSVSSGFGSRGRYNYTFDFVFTSLQLVRIVDDQQGDIGIFYVSKLGGGGSTFAEFYGLPYSGTTSTGKLYLQEIEYQTIKPRILINKPETLVSTFSQESTINLQSALSFAHFCKPTSGFTIDTYKANAAFDNPEGEFEDPTINQLYFPKISRMLGNPAILAKFLLPESVFQSFDFQSFIYLKTEKLTGYFYVESITNYVDSNTEVTVKLLML